MGYVGLSLDQHDDIDQSLLTRLFPEDRPGILKEAQVLTADQLASLPNHAFALRAVDNGTLLRKFATVNPGVTATSIVYFLANHGQLPEEAQKFAAANLVQACLLHDIEPPEPLVKTAAEYEPAEFLDLSGIPAPINVDGPGEGVVLDSHEKVAAACSEFEEIYGNMHPQERHRFAMPLLKAASAFEIEPSETLGRYGSPDYAPSLKLGYVIRAAHLAVDDNDGRQLLEDLYKTASVVAPENFAEALADFDRGLGFDQYWDQGIPDPWYSTFGQTKIADFVYVDGNDRVTGFDLRKLALNPLLLHDTFSTDIVDAFKKNPITIFQSLPMPHKKIIMRVARDTGTGGANVRTAGG